MLRKKFESKKDFPFYEEQDFRGSEYPLITLCNNIKKIMLKYQDHNNLWKEAGVMDYGTGAFTLWYQKIEEENQTNFELFITSTEKTHKWVMYSYKTGKKIVVSQNRIPSNQELGDAFNSMF